MAIGKLLTSNTRAYHFIIGFQLNTEGRNPSLSPWVRWAKITVRNLHNRIGIPFTVMKRLTKIKTPYTIFIERKIWAVNWTSFWEDETATWRRERPSSLRKELALRSCSSESDLKTEEPPDSAALKRSFSLISVAGTPSISMSKVVTRTTVCRVFFRVGLEGFGGSLSWAESSKSKPIYILHILIKHFSILISVWQGGQNIIPFFYFKMYFYIIFGQRRFKFCLIQIHILKCKQTWFFSPNSSPENHNSQNKIKVNVKNISKHSQISHFYLFRGVIDVCSYKIISILI